MQRGAGVDRARESAASRRRRWIAGSTAALLAAAMICYPIVSEPISAQAQSRNGWRSEGEPVRRIVVTLFKSRTFHLDQPFATAVIGAPDIADVMPMSDHSLYIQGKKVGTTNLSVFDQNQRLVSILDVEVAVDVGNLQGKIQASTGSRGIHVSSSNGQVVLSGEAVDAIAAERAVALAKDFAPNGVINAMSVKHSQQVLLKVRFLEASREAGRQLGVNWFGSNANGTRGVNTGQGSFTTQSPPPAGIPVFQTAGTLAGSTAQPFGVVLANVVNGGTSIEVLVTALETKGLVRRLAESELKQGRIRQDFARFRREIERAHSADAAKCCPKFSGF